MWIGALNLPAKTKPSVVIVAVVSIAIVNSVLPAEIVNKPWKSNFLNKATPIYWTETLCMCLHLRDFVFADIDECFTEKPCKNNAKCDNIPGSYRCSCAHGHTGRNCHIG